jgi:hypothetical protein
VRLCGTPPLLTRHCRSPSIPTVSIREMDLADGKGVALVSNRFVYRLGFPCAGARGERCEQGVTRRLETRFLLQRKELSRFLIGTCRLEIGAGLSPFRLMDSEDEMGVLRAECTVEVVIKSQNQVYHIFIVIARK